MRALLSVWDKTGLVELASGLKAAGWQLVSSGGTSSALADAGIEHQKVEDLTQWPEMLGGRVKTLHPLVHGGILADRSKPEHVADVEAHNLPLIDLVVCNLYPFRDKPGIEMIDVGGPTMVRAAAKNHAHVAVAVDPADYSAILAEAQAGGVTNETRMRLARKAFAHTAAYDAAIVTWFDEQALVETGELPETLHLALERAGVLRYGENPHQVGARYRHIGHSSWWDSVVQHSGMALSYLNLLDAEAAWKLVNTYDATAAVVVKHANPCGVATGASSLDAYERAFACDPVSAFGGIVAINQPVDLALAEAMVANAKADVVLAPSYEPAARELLAKKRKNLRVLEADKAPREELDVRTIGGGLLVQNSDRIIATRDTWKVVTDRQPTDAEWADMAFAWQVCAAVKSNAIVLAKDGQAVGIGAGQPSRLDAGSIAARKADGRASGGACASDAFFPFRDGLDAAVAAGVTAIVQPGGSMRDDEVIAAANEHGVTMVFTGERHFLH
jgi:phosphoribosylaminoimidazolecarboxamide formyltransferase/IMP cyclohydrolase